MCIRGLLTALCLITACEADRQNDGSRAFSTWTVDSVPSLAIDSYGGRAFHQIRDIAASGDRIAVADDGNRTVAVFDRTGTLLYRIGREGAGPGEFQSVSDVYFLAADSVLAFDSRLRRMQVFDENGQYVRGFEFFGHDQAAMGITIPIAVLESRVIVGRQLLDGTNSQRPGMTRSKVDVIRFGMDGQWLGTVATVPGWEAYNADVGGVLIANMPIPFANGTFMDGAADRFVLALSDSNEVRIYAADGTLLHSASDAAPPGPRVAPAEIEAFKRRATEGAPPAVRPQLEAVYAEMPYPTTRAPFSWVYAGTDSTIWLRTQEQAGSGVGFRVLDGEGRPIALVTLPAELSPEVVSSRMVLGVWTDSLGVQTVRMYPVSH